MIRGVGKTSVIARDVIYDLFGLQNSGVVSEYPRAADAYPISLIRRVL